MDLSRALDADTVAALEEAWHDHLVLIFRDQSIEPEDQIRFSEYFGGPVERGLPQTRTPGDQPSDRRIALVTNRKPEDDQSGYSNEGEFWFHHDGCFNEIPYKGTILYGVEIPSWGGDTLFANMYAAYDKLSDEMKTRLEGLRSLQVYDFAMRGLVDIEGDIANYRHYRPPITITHPATGKKALYVNPLMTARVEGLSDDESQALLDKLNQYTEDQDIIYAHQWRPGDLVMLDNWCSAHARTDFPDEEIRLLRRTMVAGQKLSD